MSKKISVTLREVLDAPLISSWEFICEKYGLNEWCVKEGMASDEDTIEISIDDAYYIGILPEREKIEEEPSNIKEKVKVNSVVQINEKGQEDWVGCLVQVSEVKTWGIQGWVQIPKSGSAFIRLKWEEIEYIGEAVLTINETES